MDETQEADRLRWSNDRRKLGELTAWESNPRQIQSKDAERLADSLDRFGQVQTIAIDPNGKIVDGHQRQNVWAALDRYGAEFEVDVRVASRDLTERERQQLAVYLHRGAVGEWDFDALANWSVDIADLVNWGFDEAELGLVTPIDFSDFDEELGQLEGFDEVDVKITIPSMHEEAVMEWLANGEIQTAPGMGKGVLRRCGLL